MIFDTHAHYYDEAFDADRAALLALPPRPGVALVVCPGCDPESSRQSIALAERYGFLYAAAGYHPENLEGRPSPTWTPSRPCAPTRRWWRWGDRPGLLLAQDAGGAGQLPGLFRRPALPGGGTQPPRHRPRPGRPPGLPGHRPRPPRRPGVFHCYSGSLEDARVLVDRGWMLSFTGNITFKNARRAPDILRWLPLERLMLETDAPYMAPEPYRGQRCDSTMIARSAETVAQLRGLTRDEVEAVTLENGKKFFGIA